MFRIKKQLTEIGVLGINQRNAEYTLKYNSRHLYPLVDDKLRTKEIALKADLAVPELYGVVETEYQVRHLDNLLRSLAVTTITGRSRRRLSALR